MKAHGCFVKHGSIYQLIYGGNQSPMTVLGWMYNGSSPAIRLDRKYAFYQLFQELSELDLKERQDRHQLFKASTEWQDLMGCQQSHQCPRICDRPHGLQSTKPIIQLDKEQNEIRKWTRAVEIRDTLGFRTEAILKVCKGKGKTANGFIWKFDDST